MNHSQITQINKNQTIDEINHRIEVYDNVKASLKLARTMIQALEAFDLNETTAKKMIDDYLSLAQSYCTMAAGDAQLERIRRSK